MSSDVLISGVEEMEWFIQFDGIVVRAGRRIDWELYSLGYTHIYIFLSLYQVGSSWKLALVQTSPLRDLRRETNFRNRTRRNHVLTGRERRAD